MSLSVNFTANQIKQLSVVNDNKRIIITQPNLVTFFIHILHDPRTSPTHSPKHIILIAITCLCVWNEDENILGKSSIKWGHTEYTHKMGEEDNATKNTSEAHIKSQMTSYIHN